MKNVFLIGAGRFGKNYVRVIREVEKELSEPINLVISGRGGYSKEIASTYDAEYVNLKQESLKNALKKYEGELYVIVAISPEKIPDTLHELSELEIDYQLIITEKPVGGSHSEEELQKLNEVDARIGNKIIVDHIEMYSKKFKMLEEIEPEAIMEKRMGKWKRREGWSEKITILDDLLPHSLSKFVYFSKGPFELKVTKYKNNSVKIDIHSDALNGKIEICGNSSEPKRVTKAYSEGNVIEIDWLNQTIELNGKRYSVKENYLENLIKNHIFGVGEKLPYSSFKDGIIVSEIIKEIKEILYINL